jgi:2-keto-4-pentenoate hydratase/2-oxohepta-3-ene-1,7-dioic acid hydratase in catechol pathway
LVLEGFSLRIATFADGTRRTWGVVIDDDIVPASLVSGAPPDVLSLLRSADPGDWLERLAAAAGRRLHLDAIRLLAPIPRPPSDVIALGLNYVEHVTETSKGTQQVELPSRPVLFSKAAGCVAGPFDDIRVDRSVTQQVDWEVELALVIGREGRDIRPEDAYDHIFGYTVGNDVSARDLQFIDARQWYRGKSLDTFCPLGPWIVTRDELGEARDLRLELRVNDVVKQASTTAAMLFDIPTTIASVSAGRTLFPGDIILTGTPSGVGFGREPKEFLQHGDVVEAEIEGIGLIRNRVREVTRRGSC